MLIVGRFPVFRKLRPKIDSASRHVASHVHGLTLSRDGKLIGYITATGELPHIWVRQISGEKALQVTNGPQPDMMPDLSGDGTWLAFVSARGDGGVYVVPSLGGESKLIARGGLNPKFSPDGTRILYLDGEQRVFTVPLIGGRPGRVELTKGLKVLSAPLWSASGKQIIFDGVEASPHKKLGVGGLRHWAEASLGLRAFLTWSSTAGCFRRYAIGTVPKMAARDPLWRG
jgi:Tol biopolymer transport system component